MTAVWIYYAIASGLSLLVLPLSFHAMADRPDRGLAAARVLALALTALLDRLVRTAGPTPFREGAVWLLVLLAITLWLLWMGQHRHGLVRWLSSAWPTLLGSELVFLGSYLGAVVLVAHDPALFGTERLMDFALLEAVYSAPLLPPEDPWMAGEPVVYYWFGHHMAALPAILGGIVPEVAYNLALAYLFASLIQMSSVLLLADAGNLRRALIGGVLVGIAGNLYPAARFIADGDEPFSLFAASRVISHTITEFPILSLMVGDLHAHFTLLPILLVFLMWLLPRRDAKPGSVQPVVLLVVNALILATVMGNPWNLAALLVLFGVLKVFAVIRQPWWAPVPALATLPLLFTVPGPGIAVEWVAFGEGSVLRGFVLMWGPGLVLALGLLDKQRLKSRWEPGLLVLLTMSLVTAYAPVAGISLTLALLVTMAHRQGESLWAALAVAALILLSIPEFVYFRDPYPPPLERMNTVFKLHYAAWPLFMLASARALLLLTDGIGQDKRSIALHRLLVLLVGALLIYPVLAVTERMARAVPLPLLDGIAALHSRHPDDISLIRWLSRRLEPGDVCLEAPGTSYRWAGRVSALTGCPTLLGWEGHERLWRSEDERISRRRQDLERLYRSSDPNERRELLLKYDVEWIVVGEVERQAYSEQELGLFDEMLTLVYSDGDARVYRNLAEGSKP